MYYLIIIKRQIISSQKKRKISKINLIKLEDLNVVPLEEVRKKLDKKKFRKMVFDDETNKIREEPRLGRVKSS